MNRVQKFKFQPLTMSKAQYVREHRAQGSELFHGRADHDTVAAGERWVAGERVRGTFRPNIESALAQMPETWGRGFEEAAGFYSFIWQNAAAFIDIAGAFTRRLYGAERVRALWAILVTAWRSRHEYEPMAVSARFWFRRVCMTAMQEL